MVGCLGWISRAALWHSLAHAPHCVHYFALGNRPPLGPPRAPPLSSLFLLQFAAHDETKWSCVVMVCAVLVFAVCVVFVVERGW
jgi:hypothetical protein